MPFKHPCTAHPFYPERLSNHCQGLCRTCYLNFHKLWCCYIAKSHQTSYTALSKNDIKISTSSQLREIVYTDFQDMLVLSSSVASRNYNCWTVGRAFEISQQRLPKEQRSVWPSFFPIREEESAVNTVIVLTSLGEGSPGMLCPCYFCSSVSLCGTNSAQIFSSRNFHRIFDELSPYWCLLLTRYVSYITIPLSTNTNLFKILYYNWQLVTEWVINLIDWLLLSR
jgi:hypothetical protein